MVRTKYGRREQSAAASSKRYEQGGLGRVSNRTFLAKVTQPTQPGGLGRWGTFIAGVGAAVTTSPRELPRHLASLRPGVQALPRMM